MKNPLIDMCIQGLKGLQKEAELKGNQKEIDANNNNKIDAEDFQILRDRKNKEDSKEDSNESNDKEASYNVGFWWDKLAKEEESPRTN